MSEATATPTTTEPQGTEPVTPPTPETPAPEAPAKETDWKAEARKWEDRAKANKAAAEKLEQIEQANLTEIEKAQKRAEAAEAALAAKEAETLRLTIASKHGITGEHLDLLSGTDEAELEAKALKIAALIKQGGKGPVVPSQGKAPAEAPVTAADQFAAAFQDRF